MNYIIIPIEWNKNINYITYLVWSTSWQIIHCKNSGARKINNMLQTQQILNWSFSGQHSCMASQWGTVSHKAQKDAALHRTKILVSDIRLLSDIRFLSSICFIYFIVHIKQMKQSEERQISPMELGYIVHSTSLWVLI